MFYILQVHFAPEMWEKTRVDGTRKLKFQAVPTIFNDKISEKFSLARSTSPSISPSAMVLEIFFYFIHYIIDI